MKLISYTDHVNNGGQPHKGLQYPYNVVVDESSGRIFYLKRTGEKEISMSLKAQEFAKTLGSRSALKIPCFMTKKDGIDLSADVARRLAANESWLLSEYLPETAVSFDDFIKNRERIGLPRIPESTVENFLQCIRRMQKAGVKHRDLYSNTYVLYDPERKTFSFGLIDFGYDEFAPIYSDRNEDVIQSQQLALGLAQAGCIDFSEGSNFRKQLKFIQKHPPKKLRDGILRVAARVARDPASLVRPKPPAHPLLPTNKFDF